MSSSELRNEFLSFFKKKGHKIVPSSSLLPSDPSVLFTTAGMQQFKEYFLGKKSPYGNKVVSCQKCFRTSDIEEVGDVSHLTFLEMLGNFSFGDYFKEEAIKLAYEFLFKKLKLPLENAVFTVFEGDANMPADEESILIWRKLGIPGDKIKKCGKKDNFWGPTGEEGPCGPTTEIHLNGIEVWNLVFNEYYQDKQGKLTPLKQKGVDTGMGLERLAMVVQEKSSVFETDLFAPLIREFLPGYERERRIVADHIKSAVFLISEGIQPLNIERGYISRRILRRAIRYGKLMETQPRFLEGLTKIVIEEIYKNIYSELKSKEEEILSVIRNEQEKFEKTLERGLKELYDIFSWFKNNRNIEEFGERLFFIYQSYGFPLELSFEELEKYSKLKDVDLEIKVEKIFHEELKKHQELSRTASAGMFKGGLADHSEQVTKYHTATHLLLAALRDILGQEVYQKGSNITAERLRFDFNWAQKLNEAQIKKVEDLVNQKIKEDIEVVIVEMPKTEALKTAKVSFDPQKYGERVKVYKIGDFSIELCGGPHVKKTGELGHFKITKEESSGAGVRRIKAILE